MMYTILQVIDFQYVARPHLLERPPVKGVDDSGKDSQTIQKLAVRAI